MLAEMGTAWKHCSEIQSKLCATTHYMVPFAIPKDKNFIQIPECMVFQHNLWRAVHFLIIYLTQQWQIYRGPYRLQWWWNISWQYQIVILCFFQEVSKELQTSKSTHNIWDILNFPCDLMGLRYWCIKCISLYCLDCAT